MLRVTGRCVGIDKPRTGQTVNQQTGDVRPWGFLPFTVLVLDRYPVDVTLMYDQDEQGRLLPASLPFEDGALVDIACRVGVSKRNRLSVEYVGPWQDRRPLDVAA